MYEGGLCFDVQVNIHRFHSKGYFDGQWVLDNFDNIRECDVCKKKKNSQNYCRYRYHVCQVKLMSFFVASYCGARYCMRRSNIKKIDMKSAIVITRLFWPEKRSAIVMNLEGCNRWKLALIALTTGRQPTKSSEIKQIIGKMR